jgi:hypothetical protein
MCERVCVCVCVCVCECTTIPTGGTATGYADGVGTNALFGPVFGIAVDASGMVLIADGGNKRVHTNTGQKASVS